MLRRTWVLATASNCIIIGVPRGAEAAAAFKHVVQNENFNKNVLKTFEDLFLCIITLL